MFLLRVLIDWIRLEPVDAAASFVERTEDFEYVVEVSVADIEDDLDIELDSVFQVVDIHSGDAA